MTDQPKWMPSDEAIWNSVIRDSRHEQRNARGYSEVKGLIRAAVEKALAEQRVNAAKYAQDIVDTEWENREARHKRLLPMARFGMKCFDEHREQLGDLDGSDLQQWAESFGLLHEVHVTEPCGELCRCVEWDDFPQECLRETDEVATLRAELAALGVDK